MNTLLWSTLLHYNTTHTTCACAQGHARVSVCGLCATTSFVLPQMKTGRTGQPFARVKCNDTLGSRHQHLPRERIVWPTLHDVLIRSRSRALNSIFPVSSLASPFDSEVWATCRVYCTLVLVRETDLAAVAIRHRDRGWPEAAVAAVAAAASNSTVRDRRHLRQQRRDLLWTPAREPRQ